MRNEKALKASIFAIGAIFIASVAVIVSLATPTNVEARPEPAAYFYGNGLLSLCESEDATDWGVCFGFIVGIDVASNAFLTGGRGLPWFYYCRPEKVVLFGQIHDVVVAYLKAHPESRHEPSSALIIKAFQEAWPCPEVK